MKKKKKRSKMRQKVSSVLDFGEVWEGSFFIPVLPVYPVLTRCNVLPRPLPGRSSTGAFLLQEDCCGTACWCVFLSLAFVFFEHHVFAGIFWKCVGRIESKAFSPLWGMASRLLEFSSTGRTSPSPGRLGLDYAGPVFVCNCKTI